MESRRYELRGEGDLENFSYAGPTIMINKRIVMIITLTEKLEDVSKA